METEFAGASVRQVRTPCFTGYWKQTKPRESGKRRKSHPTTQNAYFYSTKRGLPKAEGCGYSYELYEKRGSENLPR